jgi:excinuclease ABC subunit A
MIAFFDQLELTHKQQLIGEQILKEIKARLEFLQTVGLNYLTLIADGGDAVWR